MLRTLKPSQKQKKTWMKTQEYVFKQQHQETLEWKEKLNYLRNLKSTNEMKGFEKGIVYTILDILKNSQLVSFRNQNPDYTCKYVH
jgi:hypothetical protein